jgi:coniferyl-aldehyde dehydrogenase
MIDTSAKDRERSADRTLRVMRALLDRQRAAYLSDGHVPAEIRIGRIDRVIDMVVRHADPFVEALREDFGHRSAVQSLMTDIFGILPSLKHSRGHVREWMRRTAVGSGPLGLIGARSWIEWKPLGIVGIISPWNFPVGLALQPLAQAFAAGNRAMIKLSEFTPRTADLLQKAIAESFDETEAAVITGGPDIGAAFSSLPFDHLFFTGAGSIARHVQRAAAEHLVPVTLELGGKSPVVIAPEADLERAAKRIALGKMLNAGQICLSPDHVFVPRGKERPFAAAMQTALTRMLPRLIDNDDYTSIVSERHYRRLLGYIEDARAKGAEIIEVNPANENFSNQPHHKLPPTLMLNVRDDMRVMQEEIFGPLLPILSYGNLDEVIRHVNAGPRPLASYYFGRENDQWRRYLDRTTCGGVTLNDVLLHVSNENLPFGGVGASGTGYYHGRAGFETFSHACSVMRSAWLSPVALMSPPYGPRFRKMLAWRQRSETRAVAKAMRRHPARRPVSSSEGKP